MLKVKTPKQSLKTANKLPNVRRTLWEWEGPSTFGSAGCRGGRRFPICSGEASWSHQCLECFVRVGLWRTESSFEPASWPSSSLRPSSWRSCWPEQKIKKTWLAFCLLRDIFVSLYILIFLLGILYYVKGKALLKSVHLFENIIIKYFVFTKL